jgi:hypothetical protein
MERLRRATDLRRSLLPVAALLALLLVTLGPLGAGAAMILSPVAALSNTLGQESVCCDISHIFDQSGLSLGFTSGVTDFDVYIASDPLHSAYFNAVWRPEDYPDPWDTAFDQEFFGPVGTLSGTIVLDLGGTHLVDRLALWNEDSTGIEVMQVRTSDDPNFLVGVTDHGSFSPTANAYIDPPTDYPAEVFALSMVFDRYVEIDLTCNANPDNNCGIGEIAFSVPEPTTALLLGLGMAGLAVGGRRPRAS